MSAFLEYISSGLPLLELKQVALWFLQKSEVSLQTAEAQRVTGFILCGLSANRIYMSLLRYKRVEWAKNKGMTALMRARFIIVVWMYFIMLIPGGVLNAAADLQIAKEVYLQYKFLPSILAVASLILLAWNYVDLIGRAVKQGKTEKIPNRLRYAVGVTERRGVKFVELLFVPLAFIFPWVEGVRWLIPLVEQV